MPQLLGFYFILLIVFMIIRISKNKNSAAGRRFQEFKEAAKQGIERVASDGHRIDAKDDISCARYGHDHSREARQNGFSDRPFIVHNEPAEGYINLNGKILKRSEADEYMRRHG